MATTSGTGTGGGGQPAQPAINILILGATGVGKSTFINAFGNYISYATLDEAKNATLIKLISTSFDMMDLNRVVHRVNLGVEATEASRLSDSQTQRCVSYLLPYQGRTIRLIDTPGIGDTRGLDYDRKNTQNILSYISSYPSINGILILLKPNEARLSPNFTFCFKELMCHLHKSSCDNIVFVFTNSRTVMFRAGETLVPLRILLTELSNRDRGINIPLTDPDRQYYFDNDAFRYLAAIKQGIEFDEDDVQDYNRSWTKSALETSRMINYITGLQPHATGDMLSINEARRLIIGFSKPLGDIAYNIEINMDLIFDQENKIEEARSDIDLLKAELRVPKVIQNIIKFNDPVTVCGSKKCTRVLKNGQQDVLSYPHCHDPCFLENVTPEVKNVQQLKNCSVMFGINCSKCNCIWSDHMHLYYDIEEVLSEGLDVDPEAIKNIRTREQLRIKTEQILADLKKQRDTLEYEQKEIRRIGARFAHFLKMNAIEPYNDAVSNYMDHLIEGEKMKNDQGGNRAQILHRLDEMKRQYDEEKLILEGEITEQGFEANAIKPSEIAKLTREIFKLPINGTLIKRMVLEFEDVSRKEQNFTEITLDLSQV